ncbi:ABC transporter ATP-binding protein [Dactylosporangium sp. NPDC000555]|uniref:ABC transporter ATP-binding protein n=1 Tax=Dactylosporangium sp. NPDC000555 TaxID=3154260 RepID=UPI0033343403
MTAPLLEVDDLRTWFRTDRGIVHAVDGVSLTVGRTQSVGIVGESGSGKSVLARSIMGLLPPRRTLHPSGRISFEGQDLAQLPARRLRRLWGAEIAMVFQNPMTALNPVVRIGRQLTECLPGLSGAAARAKAVELLRSVGIPAPERRLAEYPHSLSGGMRQRVTIAMALARDPKLLIADEPTTALDVTVQAQILDLLERKRKELEMSMIIITHDLGVVAGRTDSIVVMYAGKVVERAPTRTLFARPRMPYTEALLKAIPRIDDPPHTRLDAIGGRPPDLVDPGPGCRFRDRCRYAQPRCALEEPPLRPAETPGHEYACWFPVGTPEGAAAAGADARTAGRPAISVEA